MVGNIIYVKGEPVKMMLRADTNHFLNHALRRMSLQYNVVLCEILLLTLKLL